MDLRKAEQTAKELIAKHCPDYKFKFDNAKVRFGACNYRTKYISLSKYLTYLNDEQKVIDTILHEIAHALNRGQGHNYIWRKTAISLGCDGNRCYDGNKVNHVKGKYVYQCPVCKSEHNYHRRITRNTACGKCCKKYNNNKYSDDYKIVYVGVKQ